MTATPRRRALRALAAVTVPLAAAGLLLSAFGLATVRNDSMSPTLRSGDLVLYDRWAVPARGDIALLIDRLSTFCHGTLATTSRTTSRPSAC